MLQAIHSDASEFVLRIADGLVHELATHGSSCAREIEMCPQPGYLGHIITPSSADAHAVHQVSKADLFENHLCKFDGKHSQRVDGLRG